MDDGIGAAAMLLAFPTPFVQDRFGSHAYLRSVVCIITGLVEITGYGSLFARQILDCPGNLKPRPNGGTNSPYLNPLGRKGQLLSVARSSDVASLTLILLAGM